MKIDDIAQAVEQIAPLKLAQDRASRIRPLRNNPVTAQVVLLLFLFGLAGFWAGADTVDPNELKPQNLRVQSVKIGYPEAAEHPFTGFLGYELSMLAELPVAGMTIKEGRLTRATTLAGQSLLPKQYFDQSIRFVKSFHDLMTFSFDIKLELPDENETGFSEIAGVLHCFCSDAIRSVDLGIMPLQEGSANDAEGISIVKVSRQVDEMHIAFKMNVLEQTFKEIQLFTEDDRQIETRSSGRTTMNDYCTACTIVTKESLPEKGRLVLVLNDNIKEFEMPFSLSNISLVGKPLN